VQHAVLHRPVRDGFPGREHDQYGAGRFPGEGRALSRRLPPGRRVDGRAPASFEHPAPYRVEKVLPEHPLHLPRRYHARGALRVRGVLSDRAAPSTWPAGYLDRLTSSDTLSVRG